MAINHYLELKINNIDRLKKYKRDKKNDNNGNNGDNENNENLLNSITPRRIEETPGSPRQIYGSGDAGFMGQSILDQSSILPLKNIVG